MWLLRLLHNNDTPEQLPQVADNMVWERLSFLLTMAPLLWDHRSRMPMRQGHGVEVVKKNDLRLDKVRRNVGDEDFCFNSFKK